MLDLLIKNGTIITVDDRRRIVAGDIAVSNGRIVALADRIEQDAKEVIDATGCAVLPGLVNAHTHIYQMLIRGIGYDMHFEPWNWRFLFPIVSMMSPEHSRLSARLAAAEMIKSGTTTVCDHWYMHTDFDNIRELTQELDQSGMRACIVYGLLDKSFAGLSTDDESMTMVHSAESLMEDADRFVKEWHQKNRTTVALGVGTTQDASPELLARSQKYCLEHGLQNNFHVAGWSELITHGYRAHGLRDVEYLKKCGYIGPNMVYVHAVWLTPEEINIMAKSDTRVVHCPVANAQLGYGVAPVPEMLARSVSVSLGTDGAASYTGDLFSLMRTAAYLQKQKHLSADSLTAEQALEMATINGARTLNLDHEIGSLEVGKRADIILVDFNQPHLLPVNRYSAKLVYSSSGHDVKTTIVEGKVLMRDRKLLTIDEEKTVKEAVDAATELVENASTEETARLLNAPWGRYRPYWRTEE